MCLSLASSKKQTAPLLAPVSGRCSTSIGSIGTNTIITQQFTQHLALLHGVIQSQRWSSFEKIALSNPRVFQMIFNTIPITKEFKDTTLLHACLRSDPPFEIVAKMLTMMLPEDRTSALRIQDKKGRTPLHIAAAYNANPMVIKLLGSTDPTTCTILDEDKRTPLHLACDSSCNLAQDQIIEITHSKDVQRQQDSAPSYDVVRALLSDSLEASLVEDEDGMNALECAILSDASLDIVSLLQKATMGLLQGQERLRDSKKRRLMDGVQ